MLLLLYTAAVKGAVAVSATGWAALNIPPRGRERKKMRVTKILPLFLLALVWAAGYDRRCRGAEWRREPNRGNAGSCLARQQIPETRGRSHL